ncbi:hypothetical protein [Microseira wollei]|uniref:Uncharacterized protein n=1 Tax=Microseira wollei NIES-4236 TaxID=2530354 RepID=A0AAV3XGU7_9CYAN|nr:hypothetical protein [Microseira wollei]GET39956.1 hypothetical protein MiSe_47290 [Microseira wollei NIES-4236]
MATGASQLFYPNQPIPLFNLERENSYFLVKLHDTQAFFQTNWLGKAGLLTLSSSVTSSLKQNSPTQSLHKISTIQKNTPCRLGIGTNLTDWLPASPANSLRIDIKYTVFQEQPIRNFITHMEQADLVAKLSLRPDWAVALKVSNVVGKLLSYLVQEGSQHEIFSLTIDLNVADLKTGYYVAIGSHSDEVWTPPKFLQIDDNGRLIDKTAESSLSCLSYAVIQVLGIKRLQEQMFRDEPWWDLLQTVKDDILDSDIPNAEQRQKLLGKWRFALEQVKRLTRNRSEYLLPEIREIIAAYQDEVDQKLLPQVTKESFGLDEELPADIQEILEVKTEGELRQLANNYRAAVKNSKYLLEQYQLSGD